MTTEFSYRLDGLEPDNLLAFLSLLGLLRAVEASDREAPDADKLRPRAAWDVDGPPLRPRLFLSRHVAKEDLLYRVSRGLDCLAAAHDFDGRKDLNYSRKESRALLEGESSAATPADRDRADLFSSLMSDAAIKADKEESVAPTPLCLLFGQGHQHFLERLARVPREPSSPPRGRGKNAVMVPATECLGEALFQSWHRDDATPSFRWDPEEDVRYAMMAGDPTDAAYKTGTQHGANRLAAVALPLLTLAPEVRAGRVRPTVVGGMSSANGFSFAWPIWRAPATPAAIRALLAHPDLRTPDALAHLGIRTVFVAQRISVGQFLNFTRARLLRNENKDT